MPERPSVMTYTQLMQAARSDNPLIRQRGREQFIRRLQAKRLDERLPSIERDVLCRMYNMDPEHVFALWRKGIRY